MLAAKAAGASAYLLKPFKLDMLEKTIEHVLGGTEFMAAVPEPAK
jgi:DNA-binding NarL/FixJ family response regulator